MNPKFAPDAISIRLLGPGVIEETKANNTSPAKSSKVIHCARHGFQRIILREKSRNVLSLLLKKGVLMQQKAVMDSKDKRILQELSADGRISNAELAKRVALSPSSCLRRVQELERSGVIRGYRAVLDAGRLGLGFTAYVAVGIADHSKSSQRAFEEAISGSDAVRECHNVTGNFEYLLRVECSDLAAYKVFHSDVLRQTPQVTLINSYVVMESPKDLRA